MAIEKLISNAKWSRKIWQEALVKCPELARYFHARPTNSGVTLVTTHESRKLNGLTGCKENTFANILLQISNELHSGIQIDDILDELHFKVSGESKREADLQACIIRNWSDFADHIILKFGLSELIFVASELILQETEMSGGQKADIVAYGDNKIVFIELKNADNKKDDPVAQVIGYIEKYKDMDAFYELVNEYPIAQNIHVQKGETMFVGLAVYGYQHDIEPSIKQISTVYEMRF